VGREEEHLGRGAVPRADGRLVKVVEGGGARGGEGGEGEVDEVVPGGLGGAGEDVVGAVDEDDGGVFDAGEVARVGLGEDERARGGPCEVGGEGFGLAGGEVGGDDAGEGAAGGREEGEELHGCGTDAAVQVVEGLFVEILDGHCGLLYRSFGDAEEA